MIGNLYMDEGEVLAIEKAMTPPKFWRRYVDYSLTILKKNAVTTFHETLNSIGLRISCTVEDENNDKRDFLYTELSRQNGTITVNVYRKPTPADRYLDFSSHHDEKSQYCTNTFTPVSQSS